MNYDQVAVLLVKSKSSYNSAVRDHENGSNDRAISSLYYSCFQALFAYMLHTGKSSSKHTYVRSFLNKELTLTGKVPVELSKMYNELMDMRSDADYSPTVLFTSEEVSELFEPVQRFNEVMESLIKDQGN